MRTIKEILSKKVLFDIKSFKNYDSANMYILPEKKAFLVLFANIDGWEHVSVSLNYRCPTWNEMCKIKDIFFYEDETVLQFHPSKDEYVNIHPYCLHMWRQKNTKVILPPKHLI